MKNLNFWGKAQPAESSAAVSHPVAYHLLDVAASAEAILAGRPVVGARAGRLLHLEPNDACRLLVALIALHDLGKFAPAFQVKAPECWPVELGDCDPARVRPGRHTEDGLRLWSGMLEKEALPRLWPAGRTALGALAPAIFGHHGRPVKGGDAGGRPRSFMSEAGLSAARECMDAVLSLLMPTPILGPDLKDEQARLASWWVAGLTTLADWVGSNHTSFPYSARLDDDASLRRYWDHARERARVAVSDAGLVAPRIARHRSFFELTGQSQPSPAQRWATDVDLPDGPVLAIIEDVTGAGKTEAAQLLVHRLMTAGRASGAYWAMPTQATANAMYDRQAKTLDALFDPVDGVKPSLVLSHGQQKLHEAFRATVLDGSSNDLGTRSRVDDESEPTGTAACTAFLADDRRAALLADVGSGTVDQAILGVLPSKFNTLRLFGLADKVLVIDEAHAYDAYMGVEVQELLRFHAAMGGCAVVLSATLSGEQREHMVAAWTEGAGGGRRRAGLFTKPARLTASDAYPLATVVGESGVREFAIEAATWSRRSVSVRMVSTADEALEHVIHSAEAGGAVAWIRNTVDDCLAAAVRLRERGLDPLVFHARFAQSDRQRRERDVLALFGKDASTADRRGRVLVATQVIEQSLDLDFDAMVSDVAPIDFLVQRAGRLQRHPERNPERPAGLPCELLVLAPRFDEDPPRDWLAGDFAGTRAVYEDAGVLWRTVRVLHRIGRIDTPEGLRDLVEAVYASDDVPTALSERALRAEGKQSAYAAAATFATLKVTDGYDAGAQAWVSDLRAPTRLGDKQTTVRLARVHADGALAPWAEVDGPAWKAWALSEVRLSARRVPVESNADARYDRAIAVARAQWGKWEQEVPLLPLSMGADGWYEGVLLPGTDKKVVTIRYRADDGVTFVGLDA